MPSPLQMTPWHVIFKLQNIKAKEKILKGTRGKITPYYRGSSISIEQQLPVSPSPKPLATTILLSTSMNLTTLDISFKWNHALLVLL